MRPALWLDLSSSVSLILVGKMEETELSQYRSQSEIEGKNDENTILFGRYEQDDNTENGQEPIQWRILDIRDNKALLMSWYCLDMKPYHENNEDISWETCSLRGWLNNEFLNIAFTPSEQEAIVEVTVNNGQDQRSPGISKNASFVNTGRNTQDKVFVPSYAELAEYFDTNKYGYSSWLDIDVGITPYVASLAGKTWNIVGDPWMRSPGYLEDEAERLGSIGSRCDYVSYPNNLVLPLIWVDLDLLPPSVTDAD